MKLDNAFKEVLNIINSDTSKNNIKKGKVGQLEANNLFYESYQLNYGTIKTEPKKGIKFDNFNSEKIKCSNIDLIKQKRLADINLIQAINSAETETDNINKDGVEVIPTKADISINFEDNIDNTKYYDIGYYNFNKNDYSNLNIIGQFNLGFIVTELKGKLYLIEQHAANEKFNYESKLKNISLSSNKLTSSSKLIIILQQELKSTAYRFFSIVHYKFIAFTATSYSRFHPLECY